MRWPYRAEDHTQSGSREAQFLADAEPRTLFDHGVGERDIGERQSAVPEDDRLVVALAAGFQAGDDLAHLGMQGLLRQLAGVDMGPQAAERTALALAPVVDDELLGDVSERQLDGAHRAVGDDERRRLDPFGLEQRFRRHQPRRLDDDIGAFDAGAPVGGRYNLLAEVARQAFGEAVAAFRPLGMDANLVEVEEV